jgi:hypothetical protein
MMNGKIDISEAIKSLDPTAQFATFDGTKVEWFTAPISDEAIEAEVTRLQAEYDSQQYARSRSKEYPDIGDQLDSLFHAGAFPEDMRLQLQAVKDAYPKQPIGG